MERLTRGVKALMIAHVLAWAVIPLLGQSYLQAIVLDPQAVLQGEVWRLVSYMLANPDILTTAFSLLALFFFAPPVESRYGTRGLMTIFFGGAAVASLVFMAFGLFVDRPGYLAGSEAANVAILVAFAHMNPDARVLLFFALPVRAVWIVGIWVIFKLAGMWQVQMVVWPSVAEILAAGAVWLYLGGGLGDFNPIERFRNWRYRRKMQKFRVHSGGRKSDPGQYLH